MENKSKSGTKRRTTRWSRRGTSMDFFIFHPTRPSFYWSFSTDSEITSPFRFNSNPYPSSNSSILSGLLNQEDGPIAPNSSSQTFSFGFVEDLSVWVVSYTAPASAESLNWFGSQHNLLDLRNPPILLPSHQDPPILSPVQQDVQPPLMFQQNVPSPHPCSPNDFSGSVQIFHFLLIPLTLAHLTFSIWPQPPFFQVGMSILNCNLLSRGDY